MVASAVSLRVGIYGPEEIAGNESRGCALWETGYGAAVRMAGAEPVRLAKNIAGRPWDTILAGLHALIWTGRVRAAAQPLPEEMRLCQWCRKHRFPLLVVDEALHLFNTLHEGTLHLDLCKERPDALQHRHPPERGLRHAIEVSRGTRLARTYGEGELVVNSEHRQAINRVARGFHVSARALDGIIEAIETDADNWFAVGVQWRPAAATASGLDIQLFRGLVEAARGRLPAFARRARLACTSAA
jgi:putative glutamine amidotransferase